MQDLTLRNEDLEPILDLEAIPFTHNHTILLSMFCQWFCSSLLQKAHLDGCRYITPCEVICTPDMGITARTSHPARVGRGNVSPRLRLRVCSWLRRASLRKPVRSPGYPRWGSACPYPLISDSKQAGTSVVKVISSFEYG